MSSIDPKYTDPKQWGPPFWHMMRTVAHNYPDQPKTIDKTNAKTFFINLQNILPCAKCRTHYSNMLAKYPLVDKLCCKTCLVKWVEMVYGEISRNK